MNIEITIPNIKNDKEISNLFSTVISHTFRKEKIFNPIVLQKELKFQILNFRNCMEDNENIFYVAQINDTIVGTISCGKRNDIIKENTDIAENIFEIRSVYVLPKYHGKGIGSMMFNKILSILKDANAKNYCLDSGYSLAQNFWSKKLGSPYKTIENYWGKNLHHKIWLVEI